MCVAIVITTLALATGAYSQQSLRQDPEVNYSPVSDGVRLTQYTEQLNVTFLAPTDYQQGIPS